MGVIADFIIATEPEALEYSRSQKGIPSLDLLEAKGITVVELTTLLAILEGKEWQDELLDLFPTVSDSGDVTRVAERLMSRLTDFDYDLEAVSADWASTEEMHCEPEEARTLIEQLAQLAVRAKSAGKPIYLWNCV